MRWPLEKIKINTPTQIGPRFIFCLCLDELWVEDCVLGVVIFVHYFVSTGWVRWTFQPMSWATESLFFPNLTLYGSHFNYPYPTQQIKTNTLTIQVFCIGVIRRQLFIHLSGPPWFQGWGICTGGVDCYYLPEKTRKTQHIRWALRKKKNTIHRWNIYLRTVLPPKRFLALTNQSWE